MRPSGKIEPELLSELHWQLLSEPGDRVAGILVKQRPAKLLLQDLAASSLRETWSSLLQADDPRMLAHLENTIERMRRRNAALNLDMAIDQADRFGFRPVLVSALPELEEQMSYLGDSRPRMLWIAGSLDALANPALGIVGSRQCSSYGLTVVREVVQRLTSDHAVVSGGAVGIDAEAHRSALRHGVPTISYLAGGPDRLYPNVHLPLFAEITQHGGALIAECAPGTPPGRWRFLQRNRLIAAHAKVILVAESNYRSGARNTARIAAELCRAVYAVPGPVTSSASAGCNLMIAHGTAQCMADFDEPVDALTGNIRPEERIRFRPPNEQRVLDALADYGKSIEEIAAESGVSLRESSQALESLLARAEVEKRGDKWFRIPY